MTKQTNDTRGNGAHLKAGALGEAVAAAHLVRLGHQVVARNWRLVQGDVRGELDLVSLDHARRAIVITEVKTRRSALHGGPLAAVGHDKQRRLRLLAIGFLAEAHLPYADLRFDVIGVLLDGAGTPRRLEHLRDAF